MIRDGNDEEYNKAMARDIYERRVSSGMYQMREALQDSMLGLKAAMESILKAEGKNKGYIEDIPGFENPYLGENRLSSVNQAECEEFSRQLFKPMLEEVAKLAKTADQRAELTDYMMAKHGLERNDVMATRDAQKKAQKEFADFCSPIYSSCMNSLASPPWLVSRYSEGKSCPVCFITSTVLSKDIRCTPSAKVA